MAAFAYLGTTTYIYAQEDIACAVRAYADRIRFPYPDWGLRPFVEYKPPTRREAARAVRLAMSKRKRQLLGKQWRTSAEYRDAGTHPQARRERLRARFTNSNRKSAGRKAYPDGRR